MGVVVLKAAAGSEECGFAPAVAQPSTAVRPRAAMIPCRNACRDDMTYLRGLARGFADPPEHARLTWQHDFLFLNILRQCIRRTVWCGWTGGGSPPRGACAQSAYWQWTRRTMQRIGRMFKASGFRNENVRQLTAPDEGAVIGWDLIAA